MGNASFTDKIKKNPFYAPLYEQGLSPDHIFEAGFFDDRLKKLPYRLKLLTTPLQKINTQLLSSPNPVVLLSCGAYCPLHQGHIAKLEAAKLLLEDRGYSIIGGYLSPHHDHYINPKYGQKIKTPIETRIALLQEQVNMTSWLMVDPWEGLYTRAPVHFTDVILRLELYLQKFFPKVKVIYVFGSDNAHLCETFTYFGHGVCVQRPAYEKDFISARKKYKNNPHLFFTAQEIKENISAHQLRQENKKILQVNQSFSISSSHYVRHDLEMVVPSIIAPSYAKMNGSANEELIKEFRKIIVDSCGFKSNIKIFKFDKQLSWAKEQIKLLQKKNSNLLTISVDPLFKADINLNYCHMGTNSVAQGSGLLVDYSKQSFASQLQKLKGNTIDLSKKNTKTNRKPQDKAYYEAILIEPMIDLSLREKVQQLLFNSVFIKKKITLINAVKDTPVFTYTDISEFLLGSKKNLIYFNIDKKAFPVPMIKVLPYFFPHWYSKIPLQKQLLFSSRIWLMNYNFYCHYPKLSLKDLNKELQKFFRLLGFDKNITLKELSYWHYLKTLPSNY